MKRTVADGGAPTVGAAMAMESLGLGLFMVSAGLFGTALEYPGSPLHQAMPSKSVCDRSRRPIL